MDKPDGKARLAQLIERVTASREAFFAKHGISRDDGRTAEERERASLKAAAAAREAMQREERQAALAFELDSRMAARLERKAENRAKHEAQTEERRKAKAAERKAAH